VAGPRGVVDVVEVNGPPRVLVVGRAVVDDDDRCRRCLREQPGGDVGDARDRRIRVGSHCIAHLQRDILLELRSQILDEGSLQYRRLASGQSRRHGN